jgi:hypothetical protein
MPTFEFVGQDGQTVYIRLAEGDGVPLYLQGWADGEAPSFVTSQPPNYPMVVMQLGGRWVLMAPGRESVLLNACPVVGFKVLNHSDRVEVLGRQLRFSAEEILVVRPDSPLIQERKACPICKNDFEVDQQVIFCPRCSLPHHHECWYYNGRCGSYPFCGYVVRQEATEAT